MKMTPHSAPRNTSCTRLDCRKIMHPLYQQLSVPRNSGTIPFFGQSGCYALHKSGKYRGKVRPDHAHITFIINCTKIINTNLTVLDLWTKPMLVARGGRLSLEKNRCWSPLTSVTGVGRLQHHDTVPTYLTTDIQRYVGTELKCQYSDWLLTYEYNG